MKGIILAGGSGTRLYPATKAISKQLMPVYDKPMIYYPVSTMMLAGIRDIMIISTPRDVPLFQGLLGDGNQWGVNFSYAVQEQPRGLADAFIIGKKFIGGSNVAMILGDNLYYGQGLGELVKRAASRPTGATVFGYRVSDPERYGVVAYNKQREPIDIIEKPKNPPSNWAVTGMYFYDNNVINVAENLKPSPRGEIEITDVNKHYLAKKQLDVIQLGRGYAWLDTGTHESLDNAAEFVRIVEQRQGLKIGCPEEIAFNLDYIGTKEILKIADEMGKTGYGDYLRRLAESER
ncbi:MAG: glucose-1-phosphate thymidylyltransferase RfbA [Alphaproteobacteria bacterium]|nr:glucose-1-phosphate thymidylyltransferase RfbA [Alphaproteobacteria bacterium]